MELDHPLWRSVSYSLAFSEACSGQRVNRIHLSLADWPIHSIPIGIEDDHMHGYFMSLLIP
jgi:hypothetical protein